MTAYSAEGRLKSDAEQLHGATHDLWLEDETVKALKLQRQLPDEALRIVAGREKRPGACPVGQARGATGSIFSLRESRS
jgi:hypothetical protein